MRHPRLSAALIVFGLLATACSSAEGGAGDGSTPSPADAGQRTVAIMASTDLYVGAPQRVALGLVFGAEGELVSFGSVDLAFSYIGTAEEPSEPQPGPNATAVYLPTPGTADGSGGPTLTLPSEARGVYEAVGVGFDRAGFWQVLVTADVEGVGAQRALTTFGVAERPALPAPGDQALPTENLTIASEDAPGAAIDSRFTTENGVPDPQLHEWTIARAIAEGRPTLVVFATPVYCVSQFCGPVTDMVAELADRYGDRAVFIHVEIWRDFQEQVINAAAADWLLRDGDLTEPWLYLIDADGNVVDRWNSLWRKEEVVAALEALPPMRAN